jgi:peptidoglycan/xylan/chitin deacetylase (PgdA/CDA1 family)
MGPFPVWLRARAVGIGLLLGLVVVYGLQGAWWGYVLVLWVAFTVAYFGTTQIASHFYLPTYNKGSGAKKQLALTFDDGIVNPEQTRQVLKILEQYNAPAAFFCIGKNLQTSAQQTVLKELHEQGHLVGNHSYSHANLFDFYGSRRVLEEIRQTDALVERLIGQRPLFFRPPYGITTPNIANALRQVPHRAVGWSLRSLDTVIKQEELLLQRLKKRLHLGAVVLFHDHTKSLPQVLPLFLDYVLKEGYTVIGLDELLDLPAYS